MPLTEVAYRNDTDDLERIHNMYNVHTQCDVKGLDCISKNCEFILAVQ